MILKVQLKHRFNIVAVIVIIFTAACGTLFSDVNAAVYEWQYGSPLVTSYFTERVCLIKKILKKTIVVGDCKISPIDRYGSVLILTPDEETPGSLKATTLKKVSKNNYRVLTFVQCDPDPNRNAYRVMKILPNAEIELSQGKLNRLIDQRHFSDPVSGVKSKQQIRALMDKLSGSECQWGWIKIQ